MDIQRITRRKHGGTVKESMEGWLVKLTQSHIQKSLDESLDKWLADLKAEAEIIQLLNKMSLS